MLYTVRHFKLGEFVCPCCGQVRIDCGLVLVLDFMRRRIGVPVRISSGYRCAAHNVEVGGVQNSRHLLGLAADLPLPPALDFAAFERAVRPCFPTEEGYECKAYLVKKYIHVAVPRGAVSEWDGGPIFISTKGADMR